MSERGPVVVKVGGAVAGAEGPAGALDDVAALARAGRAVVVVHGGGAEITRWSRRAGIESRFVAGLRYSDPDTVAVAEMALARVGKDIALALTRAGTPAVSLGGRDAELLLARPLRLPGADGRPVDLGLVGEIVRVRVEVLRALLGAGLLPVVGPVAAGEDGQTYNVNADDVAADVAAALGAEVLCLCTDVPGILADGSGVPLPSCDEALARALIARGVVSGGMRPKVEACLRAVRGGVGRAWIVDGRRERPVRRALDDEPGAGTAVVRSAGDGDPPAADGRTGVEVATVSSGDGRRPETAGVAAGPAGSVRERALQADLAYLLQTYGRAPVVLERGSGTTVWDTDGRAYLDFLCGIGVTNLGHCHPRVVAAVTEQVSRLAHVSNLYHSLPQIELAEALVAAAGCPARAFFCNSGAEANEAALKLARKAAWRRAEAAQAEPAFEIVCFEHSFHGRTYGALSATFGYQRGFGPMLPGFHEAPWNDPSAAEARIGPRTAGVIVEPVQGEGGVRVASPEFLRALRALCDRHGACLIFDEVQCGLGRAGSVFAFQHFGVRPDVVTLGKALGGGLPMGGILAMEGWWDALGRGDHATTFGGNPVVAAAGLAAFRVLVEEGLAERAARAGEGLRAALRARFSGLPYVREVRGLGLMTGIELAADGPSGPEVVAECRARGLLINCTAGTVLRLLPPLTVREDELERGVGILADALQAVAVRSGVG